MRILVAILFTLFVAGAVYAHDADDQYKGSGYQAGYSTGYQHGWRDQQDRASFEFRGSDYSSTSDCDFRSGYVEGYADGYFRRPSEMQQQGNYYNDHDRDYDRDDHHGNNAEYGSGEVIAFADTGFHGSARAFPPGQYGELKDGWDDKIESIQVNGPVRVVLFDKKDFKGQSVVVTQNAPDLGDFRKKAASMVIEPLNYR